MASFLAVKSLKCSPQPLHGPSVTLHDCIKCCPVRRLPILIEHFQPTAAGLAGSMKHLRSADQVWCSNIKE